MTAIALIVAERERQKTVEQWSERHDDTHGSEQLARAAACYAMPAWMREEDLTDAHPRNWPWAASYWKPTPDDRIRELVKAGALIVAEIERLQRAESPR